MIHLHVCILISVIFFSESDDSIVSSLLMFLLSNIRVTFCFVSAIAGSSGLLGAR